MAAAGWMPAQGTMACACTARPGGQPGESDCAAIPQKALARGADIARLVNCTQTTPA